MNVLLQWWEAMKDIKTQRRKRSEREMSEDDEWQKMSFADKIRALKSGRARMGTRVLHLARASAPHLPIFQSPPKKPRGVSLLIS